MAKTPKPKPKTAKRRTIPDPTTVIAEFELKAPDGQVYRVRRTTQTDEYEKRPKRGRPGK